MSNHVFHIQCQKGNFVEIILIGTYNQSPGSSEATTSDTDYTGAAGRASAQCEGGKPHAP